jgi:hypothetical protein
MAKRKPRITLEFTTRSYKGLRRLKKKTKSKTNADVIRKSLHVLDWILEKQREGYAIQISKVVKKRIIRKLPPLAVR